MSQKQNKPYIIRIALFSAQGQFLYQMDLLTPPGHSLERTAISSNRLFMASLDEDGSPVLSHFGIKLPD